MYDKCAHFECDMAIWGNHKRLDMLLQHCAYVRFIGFGFVIRGGFPIVPKSKSRPQIPNTWLPIGCTLISPDVRLISTGCRPNVRRIVRGMFAELSDGLSVGCSPDVRLIVRRMFPRIRRMIYPKHTLSHIYIFLSLFNTYVLLLFQISWYSWNL